MPARTPRFDLHEFGCASVFGSLDLSRVPLSASITDVRTAFTRIRQLLANEHGFRQTEKAYLVYFDGPTGQVGDERICGEADAGGGASRPSRSSTSTRAGRARATSLG